MIHSLYKSEALICRVGARLYAVIRIIIAELIHVIARTLRACFACLPRSVIKRQHYFRNLAVILCAEFYKTITKKRLDGVPRFICRLRDGCIIFMPVQIKLVISKRKLIENLFNRIAFTGGIDIVTV